MTLTPEETAAATARGIAWPAAAFLMLLVLVIAGCTVAKTWIETVIPLEIQRRPAEAHK